MQLLMAAPVEVARHLGTCFSLIAAYPCCEECGKLMYPTKINFKFIYTRFLLAAFILTLTVIESSCISLFSCRRDADTRLFYAVRIHTFPAHAHILGCVGDGVFTNFSAVVNW